jgi:hypothetical protein
VDETDQIRLFMIGISAIGIAYSFWWFGFISGVGAGRTDALNDVMAGTVKFVPIKAPHR